MDSRQFAILVLGIFISTIVPAFGLENPTALAIQSNTNVSDNSSNSTATTTATTTAVPTTAVPTTHSNTDSTSSKESVTTPVSSTVSFLSTTPSIHDVTPKTTAKEVPVSDLVSVAAVTQSAVETSTVPAAPVTSTANSNKPSEVINEQSIRDVSADKCSTSYDAADKDSWLPEKIILSLSVTVEQLCKQLDTVKRLNALCNNSKGQLDSEDSKVAPVVAGLTTMFSSICSDPKAAFNVSVGDSTPCVESIKTITKSCSTNPLAKAIHVFPTEVLFEEMVKENCTVVFNTKECIIKGIEKSDKCSSAQGSAVTQAIIMVTQILPCHLPLSSETTSTAAPTTTVPKVTPTKTPSHNSANSFQVNFFTVLPVLLLAFKFY